MSLTLKQALAAHPDVSATSAILVAFDMNEPELAMRRLLALKSDDTTRGIMAQHDSRRANSDPLYYGPTFNVTPMPPVNPPRGGK